MEMDLIRVRTEAVGRWSGTLLSAEMETRRKLLGDDLPDEDLLFYNLKKRTLAIFDMDGLPDGDYALSLFETVGMPAPIVGDDSPIFAKKYEATYRYIANLVD